MTCKAKSYVLLFRFNALVIVMALLILARISAYSVQVHITFIFCLMLLLCCSKYAGKSIVYSDCHFSLPSFSPCKYQIKMTETQMDLAVKFLKHRLKSDYSTFIGNESEYRHISELISRTSECGESNSALIIGTAGSGKTTVRTFQSISFEELNSILTLLFPR